jgi:hypothetical protein
MVPRTHPPYPVAVHPSSKATTTTKATTTKAATTKATTTKAAIRGIARGTA